MTDRTITRVLLGIAATALVILGFMGGNPATDDLHRNACQEDEACWDCVTMGNMICGEAGR